MLFYHPHLEVNNIILNVDESGHLVRVLRKQSGDEIQVTDGKGLIVSAIIKDANPKKCSIEVVSRQQFTPPPYYIHIAVAPTKNIDRIAWFVEKAVEIGIQEISFPFCRNSERKILKTDKLIAKAVSAMKQSLSPFLPKVNEAENFPHFLKNVDGSAQNFIAHLENEVTPQLTSLAQKDAKYCILIGPEGDFDKNEIEAALQKGFTMVKLGEKRLRTETAALHACSMLNTLNYL